MTSGLVASSGVTGDCELWLATASFLNVQQLREEVSSQLHAGGVDMFLKALPQWLEDPSTAQRAVECIAASKAQQIDQIEKLGRHQVGFVWFCFV